MAATESARGEPTKKLFIDTLVRDVDLQGAIVDLVDNCVDGAKRVRPKGNFEGLIVKISITPSLFQVIDNCGGIPLDLAKEYAFRFGRADTHQGAVTHSVGHFGVGMKRTLFKIAEKFTVLSVTVKDGFQLDVDVDAWKASNDWNFPLKDVVRLEAADSSRVVGTVIQVAKIKNDIASVFKLDSFLDGLRERLRLAHTQALMQGLEIEFNGQHLDPLELTIKESVLIKPHVQTGKYDLPGGTVTFRMITGVGERESDEAGWYVFCNGRLLLSSDQTSETGWGEPPAVKFHQQFDRFRGYLYLEADNPGLLPWNTTKTGISSDSDVYKRQKIMMRAATQQVTKFLNKVRVEEKQYAAGTITSTPLANAINKAKDLDVNDSKNFRSITAKFEWPSSIVKSPKDPAEKKIAYNVPIEQFNAVKETLGLVSPADVGLATFEYYYSMQIEEA